MQVRERAPYESIFESAFEAEDHDEPPEPEEVLWIRSGKGVLHVGRACGLLSRAACGFSLSIMIRAPAACSTFCRRRGCLLRAVGAACPA